MNNRELLRIWVADLSQSLASDLVFDEYQVCTLAFDDDLCVSLAPSETDEALFVVAGPVLALTMDPAIDERILKAALKLNFLGAETAGGTLALSAYSGMLVFAHTLRFDGVDAFDIAISVMRRMVNYIHGRLGTLGNSVLPREI